MGKRRKIGGIVLAIIVGLGVGGLVWQSREPVVEERRLSSWIQDLDPKACNMLANSTMKLPPPPRPQWPAIRLRESHAAAEAAVTAVGTNGLPYFIRILERSDDAFSVRLRRFAEGKSILSRVFKPAPTKAHAALAVGVLGPAGEPAIPLLLGALTNGSPDVRASAAEALGRIHRQPGIVIPALVNVLTSLEADLFARSSAAWALGEFGGAAKTAIPVLSAERKSGMAGNAFNNATLALAKIQCGYDREANTVQVLDTLHLEIDGARVSYSGEYPIYPPGKLIVREMGTTFVMGKSLATIEEILAQALATNGHFGASVKVTHYRNNRPFGGDAKGK